MELPIVGGIYRHYKSTGGSDHTYQVFGIARDFESGETLVIYKPLYTEQEKSGDHDKPIQEFLAEVGANYGTRPLSMRSDMVERQGQRIARFILVQE